MYHIYLALAWIHHWLLAVPRVKIHGRSIFLKVYVMLWCACKSKINVPDYQALARIHQWLLAVPGYKGKRIWEVYLSRTVYGNKWIFIMH